MANSAMGPTSLDRWRVKFGMMLSEGSCPGQSLLPSIGIARVKVATS